jgi:hypothetical protein
MESRGCPIYSSISQYASNEINEIVWFIGGECIGGILIVNEHIY